MDSADGCNDKSHHNKDGGFVNPWPSFRQLTFFQFFGYARKHWDRQASKVPPQNELYVKILDEQKMAWEKIRSPPKDEIQATWFYLTFLC